MEKIITELNAAMLKQMLIHTAYFFQEKESELTRIDIQIGDGDHGIGMQRGWSAVLNLLSENEYKNVKDLFYAAGLELIRSMGGASGVIFGTMFVGGVDKLGAGLTASASELAEYFLEGEKKIEQRGKAAPGDKTMLDALYPACQAMLRSSKENDNIISLFYHAAEGAKEGMEKSKILIPHLGRSRNFREKAIGIPDPGAVSVTFIFSAFYEALDH